MEQQLYLEENKIHNKSAIEIINNITELVVSDSITDIKIKDAGITKIDITNAATTVTVDIDNKQIIIGTFYQPFYKNDNSMDVYSISYCTGIDIDVMKALQRLYNKLVSE